MTFQKLAKQYRLFAHYTALHKNGQCTTYNKQDKAEIDQIL